MGLRGGGDPFCVAVGGGGVHEAAAGFGEGPVGGVAADGAEDGGLVPGFAWAEVIVVEVAGADGVRFGGVLESAAGFDGCADFESAEEDGCGPVIDGADGGDGIVHDVVFSAAVGEAAFGEDAAHADPAEDFLGDERFTVEGADVVGWGVKEGAEVGEESDGDYGDTVVGLIGEELSAESGGVGGIATLVQVMGEFFGDAFGIA
ncbi:MAG: hypothetical protein RI897_814 [Verrucomicrobiota bacterium]